MPNYFHQYTYDGFLISQVAIDPTVISQGKNITIVYDPNQPDAVDVAQADDIIFGVAGNNGPNLNGVFELRLFRPCTQYGGVTGGLVTRGSLLYPGANGGLTPVTNGDPVAQSLDTFNPTTLKAGSLTGVAWLD